MIKFICLYFLVNISLSQSLNLYFTDPATSKPIRGANILVVNDSGNEFGTATDELGNAYFQYLVFGKYDIYFSHIGYEELSSEINIVEIKNYDFKFSPNQTAILFPELKIVSDSKKEKNKIMGAASVVSSDVLSLQKPIGTQEILESLPGINGFSDDGIGNSRISIGIRGLDPRRSARALILEDGIPIQPALYIYPNMYYNPPSERIDGVQVIKSSAAIRFGPQTMGGVINYYTRRPTPDFYISQQLTYGTNNYSGYFAEVNGFGMKKNKNTLQLLLKKGDGFRQNNDFHQLNLTTKTSIYKSAKENIFVKTGINYENSNATYTGLTMYSFNNFPDFNPKKDDNFKTLRLSIDLIRTKKIDKNVKKTEKNYANFFDRKWWREDDIFVSAAAPDKEITVSEINNYNDLIRIGNGSSNFGIIRKFYVLGREESYKIDTTLFNVPSRLEVGYRAHWEKFIDDKVIGDSPRARAGLFYYPSEIWNDDGDGIVQQNEYEDLNGNNTYDALPTIIGKSHHYETTAFSAFVMNKIEINSFSLNFGTRLEIFEQERINLLDGATYLDKTSLELLPGISFSKELGKIVFFGGIHKGYTSPSSGTISVINSLNLDNGLDLKSEKSWNKELGLRVANFLEAIDLEFVLFHNSINDLIAAGRSTAFENLGSVDNYGTEVSIKAQFKGLPTSPCIYLNHTFLESYIKSAYLSTYDFMPEYPESISLKGNRLPYTPKHKLSIGIEQKLYDKIDIRFDYNFTDTYFTDFHNIKETDITGNYGEVKSIGLINGSLRVNFSEKLQFSIVGKNLEDKVYIGSRLHSSPFQPSANISSGIIPGSRRQINFAIEMKF